MRKCTNYQLGELGSRAAKSRYSTK